MHTCIIVSMNTISPIITKDVADLSQRWIGTLGGHDVGQVMQRVQTAKNVVPYTVAMQCEMKYGNMKLHIQRSAENWPALRPQSGCSDVCIAQREFLHTKEKCEIRVRTHENNESSWLTQRMFFSSITLYLHSYTYLIQSNVLYFPQWSLLSSSRSLDARDHFA